MTNSKNYLQLPHKAKLPYEEGVPASKYLMPRVLEILEQGMSLQQPFFFTYGSLDTHLRYSYPHTTKGERAGVLKRLLSSDTRITKVSHGNYNINVTPVLTDENVLKILSDTVEKLDLLSTSVTLQDDGTLSKENRELVFNTVQVMRDIEKLKEKFNTPTESEE